MIPKISVITVVYNGKLTIEETIISVINQTYTNIEYIVIDGGSNDGTWDIIEKYKRKISFSLSEPDKGIFDAMNKGLQISTGEYIIYMNCGDMFYDNETLEKIFSIPDLIDHDLIYGDVVLYDDKHQYKFKSKTNSVKINLNAICHQSVLIRRIAHPLFDLKYKLCADHNLIYDFIKSGKNKYIPITISRILIGGVSSDLKKTRKEKLDISLRKGHYNDKILAYIFYQYGAIKETVRNMILYLFPKKVFYFLRSLKNGIEQI